MYSVNVVALLTICRKFTNKKSIFIVIYPSSKQDVLVDSDNFSRCNLLWGMLYIYALTNIPLHNYTCTVTPTTDKEKNIRKYLIQLTNTNCTYVVERGIYM